jgi:putative restriction endonuclease
MIAVAPTDHDWFRLLRNEGPHRTVNFWTPTPWNIRGLEEGDRFYFMRKAPIREIGGYGHFAGYKNMRAEEAWRRFGTGNGVHSLDELIDRATGYAQDRSETFEMSSNPEIGCVVLRNPEFFEDDDHIDLDEYGDYLSFPPQVVKQKYFEEVDALERPASEEKSPTGRQKEDFSLVRDRGGSATYTTQRSKQRKGQRQFRRKVLNAYGYECCITREGVSEVLEAAHIQPHAGEDSNHVQNGLTLRIDLHRLFDAGLLTVTTDGKVHLSSSLSSESYAPLDGQTIDVPTDPSRRPAEVALRYHNRFKFRDDL